VVGFKISDSLVLTNQLHKLIVGKS